MKKIIGLIFASLMLVGGLAADASAQYRPRSINNREARQQRRIYQGVRSGRLTARETYRLSRRQANIRSAEARYRRSGGRFTYAERRNIQRRLNKSNRAIYRQKHDRQNHRVVSAQPFPRRRL